MDEFCIQIRSFLLILAFIEGYIIIFFVYNMKIFLHYLVVSTLYILGECEIKQQSFTCLHKNCMDQNNSH